MNSNVDLSGSPLPSPSEIASCNANYLFAMVRRLDEALTQLAAQHVALVTRVARMDEDLQQAASSPMSLAHLVVAVYSLHQAVEVMSRALGVNVSAYQKFLDDCDAKTAGAISALPTATAIEFVNSFMDLQPIQLEAGDLDRRDPHAYLCTRCGKAISSEPWHRIVTTVDGYRHEVCPS